MSKRKTAAWFKRNRCWIVRPPDWPKNVELSFTTQELMLRWARTHGLMLKQIDRRYEDV